ncbi:hypothetical protein RB195_008266 [Necator americanus]|uniref:Rad51-like C-terminal domain-containing protein n=1 Tax=Necator americanus TaxID=51031 RepID=A0ABR1CMS8_NECAM
MHSLCYALVTHFLFHTTFNVAWLDSNGSFRAHRLVEYAKGSGETIDKTFEALERVTIARVSDHKQLIEILGLIDDYFVEYCIRLVIIDGVFEMCDERLFGENVRRSSIMGVILNKINTLTEAGCTVVTTCSQKDHESELTRNWIQQIQRSILVENDSKVRGVRVLKVKDPSQNCGRFKISSRGLRAEYS